MLKYMVYNAACTTTPSSKHWGSCAEMILEQMKAFSGRCPWRACNAFLVRQQDTSNNISFINEAHSHEHGAGISQEGMEDRAYNCYTTYPPALFLASHPQFCVRIGCLIWSWTEFVETGSRAQRKHDLAVYGLDVVAAVGHPVLVIACPERQ